VLLAENPIGPSADSVQGVARRFAPLLAAILLAAGCGGEEAPELASEDGLRECLADEGLQAAPEAQATSAALGSVTADFTVVTAEGVAVDVVVVGTEEKARRAAADISAALASLGAADAEVVSGRNAVAVFEARPSGEVLEAADGCLAG
jgi:hypothetical protein